MTASTNHSTSQTSPFSMRGLLTGVILSIAIGVIAPYGIVFNYYWIGFNPSSPGALFFFFVLTFVVNAIVAVLGRNVQLSKADLVMIYCMLLMAVTVPTWGLMFFLIGTLVYPFYYATPENNYVNSFTISSPPGWCRRTSKPSRTTRACRRGRLFRGAFGLSPWVGGWRLSWP